MNGAGPVRHPPYPCVNPLAGRPSMSAPKQSARRSVSAARYALGAMPKSGVASLKSLKLGAFGFLLLFHRPDLLSAQPVTVTCSSELGGRQHCAADTSQGVVLARSSGDAPCLLGKTWGYDDAGVWVADGCSAEFLVGPSPPPAAAQPEPQRDPSTSRTRGFGSTRERRAKSTSGFSATYVT